jgi:predicted secreted protein
MRKVLRLAGVVGTTLALLAGSVAGVAVAAPVYSESANKSVITVNLGSSFSIVLNSTYWSLKGIKGASVKEVGSVVAAPILPGPAAPVNCRLPGMGCGKLTWRFKAKKAGNSVIQITRDSCGEAMRCSNGQGKFELIIHVKKVNLIK